MKKVKNQKREGKKAAVEKKDAVSSIEPPAFLLKKCNGNWLGQTGIGGVLGFQDQSSLSWSQSHQSRPVCFGSCRPKYGPENMRRVEFRKTGRHITFKDRIVDAGKEVVEGGHPKQLDPGSVRYAGKETLR